MALLVYVGLLGLTYLGFTHVPTGFVPQQDKGYLVVNAQLPDSASLERTESVARQMEKIALAAPGVEHTVTIAGQSFLLSANGSNFASMFVILKPFHERHGAELGADAIAARLRRQFFAAIEDAQIGVFGAPPVDGIGNAGGFKLMVEDRGGNTLDELQNQVENLVEKGNAQPGLVGLFAMFRASTPQLWVDIDRTKCKTMHVALSDVFNTLQAYLGGYYVNDFNQFDRTWQVNIQADSQFRIRREDVKPLKVRNAQGGMVPLGALCVIRDSTGPVLLNRYNTHTAAAINGEWTPQISSGQAIGLMQNLAGRELPRSMDYEWTELSYQQILAGNTALFIFPLCVLLVFLTHSAEYESWALPLAIILIVPMSLLCLDRRVAPRHGQQPVHADRFRRVGRAGLQERRADRRVRQAAARARTGRAAGGGRGLEAPAPPHRDDLDGLHPRRGPADVGHGRRGGDAADPGDRRLQRHVGRDLLRRFSHARFLLCLAVAAGPVALSPPPATRGVTAVTAPD